MQRQNLYRVSRSLGQKRAGIDNMPTSDLEWTSLDTGDDSEEWQKILRLVEEQDLDWAYWNWSIDGYKYPGTTEN